MPLARGGATQFAFRPVSMTFGVWRIVEAGVAADVGIQQGSASSVGAGPEIRLAIPKATIGLDFRHIVAGSSSRVRLFFLTSF